MCTGVWRGCVVWRVCCVLQGSRACRAPTCTAPPRAGPTRRCRNCARPFTHRPCWSPATPITWWWPTVARSATRAWLDCRRRKVRRCTAVWTRWDTYRTSTPARDEGGVRVDCIPHSPLSCLRAVPGQGQGKGRAAASFTYGRWLTAAWPAGRRNQRRHTRDVCVCADIGSKRVFCCLRTWSDATWCEVRMSAGVGWLAATNTELQCCGRQWDQTRSVWFGAPPSSRCGASRMSLLNDRILRVRWRHVRRTPSETRTWSTRTDVTIGARRRSSVCRVQGWQRRYHYTRCGGSSQVFTCVRRARQNTKRLLLYSYAARPHARHVDMFWGVALERTCLCKRTRRTVSVGEILIVINVEV